MAFPDPEQYADWRSYARALLTALGSSEQQQAGSGSVAPPGYDPVWRDADGDLYRGTVTGRLPGSGRLFQIDTAQIADAAITEPTIDDFAVGSAKIKDAAIVEAKIGDLAVTTAKIDDLAVNSAKIAELVVSKLSSGTLDATIDVDEGLFRFTNGGTSLVIGNGFGTTDQLFLWFGDTQASTADCSTLNSKVHLTTSGDAFFKGTLIVGDLSTAKATSDLAPTAAISTGVIGSFGGTRVVNVTYAYTFLTFYPGPAGPDAGDISALVTLSRNGVDVTSFLFEGDWTQTEALGPSEPGMYTELISGSASFEDTTGGLSVEYSARIVVRTLGPGPGGPGIPGDPETHTQFLGIVAGEET